MNLLQIILLPSFFYHTALAAWSINNFMMQGHNAFDMFSESATAGARLAVEECQHQFKWDKWNCGESAIRKFNDNSFPTAIPEVAFLNAIMSAGVMYTLTLNCSMGHYKGCACDSSKAGLKEGDDWKWGGCNDNAAFGEKISRQYIDQLETGEDARAIVNLHNNEAGRRAVKKKLKLSCKCHGVSGSCSIRTCWKELSEFRKIGDYLKKKFLKADKVEAQNGQLKRESNSQREARDILEISIHGLVYLESAPEFCRNNSDYGAQGTLGRECRRPKQRGKERSWELRSCKRLCNHCNLQVKRTLVEQKSTCNCKFHWCCEVRCEECSQVVEKLTCVTTR